MIQQDTLFRSEAWVFSYRVAGVCVWDGKVLLQHAVNAPDYAIPGGHSHLGEVSEATVIREFKEETGLDIRPIRLLWIAENFFPWGDQACHQLCLYYWVTLCDETQIPLKSSFLGQDNIEHQSINLEFCWVELTALKDLELYPINAKEKLMNLSNQIEHFVFIENP